MSIARHTAWTLVGVGGQQLARFVVVIVLARLLAPAEFGVIAAAQIVISFAETFMNFGIGTALVQAKTVDRRTERSAMSFVLVTTAMFAAAIELGARPLADTLGIDQAAAVLPWLALGFLLQGISGPITQLMFRERRFREIALIQLTSYVVGYGATSIVLAALGWSFWSIVGGALVQSFLQFSLLMFVRPTWFTVRIDWRALSPIIRFGVGVLTASLLNNLARKGDNWIAGRLLGATALGFYSRGYSLMDMVNEVPGVIVNRVLLPHFSRHAHDDERRRDAPRQFYLSQVVASSLSLPATIGTVLLSNEIVTIVLGDRWRAVIPLLSVLGYGIFFRLGYKVSGTVTLAFGGVWQSAVRQAIYAALVLGGAFFGARYGTIGIAWAVLLALGWQYSALTTLALRGTGGSWAELAKAQTPVIVAAVCAAAAGSAVKELIGNAPGPIVRLLLVGGTVVVADLAVLVLMRDNPFIAPLARVIGGIFSAGRKRLGLA